jgi:hypothetical protein
MWLHVQVRKNLYELERGYPLQRQQGDAMERRVDLRNVAQSVLPMKLHPQSIPCSKSSSLAPSLRLKFSNMQQQPHLL